MWGIGKACGRPPKRAKSDRNGGLSELSDGVARAFPIVKDRGPTSPRHALLAERSESPSLGVIIIKTWYKPFGFEGRRDLARDLR